MAYNNPTPHIGGKKFLVHIAFNFEEWTDIEIAKASIEEYIRVDGLPEGAVSDVTPDKAYKEA